MRPRRQQCQSQIVITHDASLRGVCNVSTVVSTKAGQPKLPINRFLTGLINPYFNTKTGLARILHQIAYIK